MYDWDKTKANLNFKKHGVEFKALIDADWEDALYVEQVVHGEARIFALVPIKRRLHAVVYTLRNDMCRIISLRKANRREIKNYEQAQT